MTFEEFRLSAMRPRQKGKIRNSWGVYDYYKYYRKNKPKGHSWVLTESQYFSIVRQINELLAKKLIDTGELILPYKMGTIRFYSKDAGARITKNGKLAVTKTVNWKDTLELWYNDKEAYKNKALIYEEAKDKILLKYKKTNAVYKNKAFYDFSVSKSIFSAFVKKARNKFYELPRVFTGQEAININGLYNG